MKHTSHRTLWCVSRTLPAGRWHPGAGISHIPEVVAPDQPGISPEFARAILDLHFTDQAHKRIRKLLDKNNKGTIDEADRAVLDKYVRVGQFLDLMQAKARLSLDQSSTTD